MSRIQEDLGPFPGCQFAALVLPLDMLDTPAQQVLLLDLLVSGDRFFHSLTHVDSLSISSSQTVRPV